MKNYFKIIFVIISGAIILLNIWFATNINGAYKYEVSVNNLDLMDQDQKLGRKIKKDKFELC